MVLKFNVICKLGLGCGAVLLGWLAVGSAAMAQTNPSAEAPFIGFRPFAGGEPVAGGNSRAVSVSNTVGSLSAQPQTPQQTTITLEQPASAYPYPASGGLSVGGVSNGRTGTVERTSIGGRLRSGTTATGGLSGVAGGTAGQAAGVVPNVDPALWQRYQQELQQQQTQLQQQQTQRQYQQYQQWLAQQEQSRLQRQSSTVGYRSPQARANGASQSATATRVNAPQGSNARASAPQGNAARASAPRPTTPRLNQAVVQQVSSTTTGNRDSAVARAAWPTSSTSNSTSVAKQATSAANSVAKPQCCCVPQRCCVAAPVPARVPSPTTPVPVFRPQAVNQAANQAANQVPSLGPSVGSTFGGFLGQAGANYQVQPLGGQQFQSGLGVPQFRSTGSSGSGGWFSNGLFGRGAYTPLLPIASAQGARLGQGIIGQPTAYMDGQPIRNLLRYVFP